MQLVIPTNYLETEFVRHTKEYNIVSRYKLWPELSFY